MDTSEEYIAMCKMAVEIHKEFTNHEEHKRFYDRKEEGDLIKIGDIHWDLWGNQWYTDINFELIIVPRLDQLAMMWKNWNQNYSMAFFEEQVVNSKFYPIELSNCPAYKKQLCLPTLEQHLLVRIMWGNYHKIWDEKLKVWYTTEERLTVEEKEEIEKKSKEYEEFIKKNPPLTEFTDRFESYCKINEFASRNDIFSKDECVLENSCTCNLEQMEACLTKQMKSGLL